MANGDLGKIFKSFMSQNAFGIISTLLSLLVVLFVRDINRSFNDVRHDQVEDRQRLTALELKTQNDSFEAFQRLQALEAHYDGILQRLQSIDTAVSQIRDKQIDAAIRDAASEKK